MARTITVTSGKGGVGKTNLSLNLAVQLASEGHRTCLFDADLGLANVNVLLGQYPQDTLAEVISGEKRLSDIIIHDSSGLDIIPGSSGVEKMAELSPDEIGRIIYDFSKLNDYEFYIFDTSPGISRNVIPFCLAASELVMVITPEPTSLVDAYALLKVLTLNGFKGPVKVILNLCADKNAAKAAYNRFKGAASKRLPVDIAPVGLILRDRYVVEAVRQQTPLVRLYPQASASKSIRTMARRIVEGQSAEIEDREIVLFWTRFFDTVKGPFNLGETTATDKYLGEPAPPVDTTGPPVIEEGPPTKIFKLSEIGVSPSADSAMGEFDRLALPSLPETLSTLLQVLNHQQPGNDELFQAITLDPSLAFRILKMAAPDRAGGKFSMNGGLEAAVNSLGPDAINNLVMTESVNRVFSSDYDVHAWDLTGFWRHSMRCAYLAALLGGTIRGVDTHQAFLAGLLHDIGVLVLAGRRPRDLGSIVKDWEERDGELGETMEMLSGDHAGLGADLLGKSQIQPLIADAARYHHETPDRIAAAFPLVKVVYCAEILSRKPGRTIDSLDMISSIFKMPRNDLERLIQIADARVKLAVDVVLRNGEDSRGSSNGNGAALLHQVKTLSQLQGCTRQFLGTRNRADVVRAIHQGLEILFDLKDVVCLLYDPDANVLKAYFLEGLTPPVVQDIAIPLERQTMLGVQALTTGEARATYIEPDPSDLSLMDRQIQSFLDVEDLVYLPLPADTGYVGVVAVGGDREQLEPLFGQTSQILLNMASMALATRSEPVERSVPRQSGLVNNNKGTWII